MEKKQDRSKKDVDLPGGFSDFDHPPKYDTHSERGHGHHHSRHGHGHPHAESSRYSTTGSNTAVTTQPAVSKTAVVTKTAVATYQPYYILSIFSCIVCFWPLGIAALVTTYMADSAYKKHEDEKGSRLALLGRNLAIASIVAGVVVIIVVIIVACIMAREVVSHINEDKEGYYDYYYTTRHPEDPNDVDGWHYQ